jgi:hypothetical protein
LPVDENPSSVCFDGLGQVKSAVRAEVELNYVGAQGKGQAPPLASR